MEEIQNLDSRGWILYKNQPAKKIYYKHDESLNTISLYFEGVVEAPMMNLLAILAEIELY